MTLEQLANLTPLQRLENMRRFQALARLDARARIDPSFLSLPPRVRQDDEHPQPRS